MAEIITLPLSDFMPDRPELFHPGALTAKNVLPRVRGFGPMSALTAVSGTNAVDAVPAGAAHFYIGNNGEYMFCGTNDKLYQYDFVTDTWTDRTNAGGAYSLTTSGLDYNWDFSNYGNNVVATAVEEPVQVFDASSPGAFTDLSGSPPQARYSCVLQQFLILAHLSTDNSAIHWSEQDDITGWTVGSNLCDTQALPDGGDITGIKTLGDYALIFQRSRISRFQFTGGPTIAAINTVALRGCIAPGSIVLDQSTAYFLSDDGFYGFNGVEVFPIGSETVNRFFQETVRGGYIEETRGAFDPLKRLIVWTFNLEGGEGGLGSRNVQLIYNPVTQGWSYAEGYAECIFTVPIDSQVFPGSSIDDAGAMALLAFDANEELGIFNGTNLAATVETAEWGSSRGTSGVLAARPLVNGAATVTVRIGSRYTQGASVTYTSSATVNSEGRALMRSNGRYHRAEVTIAAAQTWAEVTGCDLAVVPSGDR